MKLPWLALVGMLGNVARGLTATELAETTNGPAGPANVLQATNETLLLGETNAATSPDSGSTNIAGTNLTAEATNAVPMTLSPEASLATFRTLPGFRVELVAGEPMVQSPVAGAFDESGRLFVVEMRGYPARRSARLGRVRLLEDTNSDGKFDLATTFADGLPWPSAIACGNGGIFVGATPDIWFFKDNDGDGVADEKRVVLTGFASDYAPYDEVKLDAQALLNNFNWGLDHRIHGVTSFSGGRLAASGGRVVDLHGRDFNFDPLGLIVDSEAGGEQSGLSFDCAGHKFTCSLRDHLQALVYDDRYALRNPYYAMPPARVSIAADGPAAPLARLTTGPGYFSMAAGLAIYRGNAYPQEFLEDAFVPDMAANLVHRKKIVWPNVVPLGRRATANERQEFLSSTDPMFRPIQALNAPDGTLYVIDFHRQVIAHPWSLDEAQARLVDLARGSDQGRIYRVVPLGFQNPVIDKLGYATVSDLAAALESNNAWQRDTATRLLLERRDPNAVPLVEKLFFESRSALGRLQTLTVLEGLGALQPTHVLRAFADSEWRVRELGLRLAERFIPSNATPLPELLAALGALTSDPSPRVRFQLALTAGQLPPPLRISPLVALVRRDLGNPWMQAAILGSLAEGADQMFLGFAGMREMIGSTAGQEFLMQLATIVGTRNNASEVRQVLAAALSLPNDTAKLALVRALNDGLERAGTSWRSLEATTNLFLFRSYLEAILTTGLANDAQRMQAVPLLAADDYANAAAALLPALGGRQAQQLQSAIIRAMGRFSGTQVAADLMDRWRVLTSPMRSELIEMLLNRPERAAVLLTALERGYAAPDELNMLQVQRLCDYPDPAIRRRARAIFGQAVNPNRSAALAYFAASLRTRGNVARGQAVFRARCIGCHRLSGEGGNYGPDLSGVRGLGRQWLLTNIIAPNRYVASAYATHRVALKTGEILEGLLSSENASSVLLRRPGVPDALLLRSEIQSIDNLGLSLMPEGVEWRLTNQNMADLLDFILSAP